MPFQGSDDRTRPQPRLRVWVEAVHTLMQKNLKPFLVHGSPRHPKAEAMLGWRPKTWISEHGSDTMWGEIFGFHCPSFTL